MILPLLRVLQVQVSCFPGSGLNFFLQLTMIFVYRLVSLFAEHVCRIVSYGSTYKNSAIKKLAAEVGCCRTENLFCCLMRGELRDAIFGILNCLNTALCSELCCVKIIASTI